MGRNGAQIYNIITIVFLVLTALVLTGVIITAASPAPESGPIQLGELPPVIQLPTVTPSNTPTSTLRPTITFTPSNTMTATATFTETQTQAPSATISDTPGPSLTPSNTPTPSVSPTPLPSATPSAPTPTLTPSQSPFFFQLSGDIFLGPNTVNSAGCAWQGIGGSVINQDGSEATRTYQIHVFGGGIDRIVLTASNSFYGANSGWEVVLTNVINGQTYFVQLESAAGSPLSDQIQVTFPNDCNANLAIIRFQQVQPLPGEQSQVAPTPPGGNAPPGS